MQTSGNKIFLPEGMWDHQKQAVTRALTDHATMKSGYFGLLHEQGCGKTYTEITILRNLFTWHKKALKTIIFCPQIVIDNWSKEIDRFSKCGQFVQKLQGKGTDRIRILKESKKSIFITNYESLDMDGLFWVAAGKDGKDRKYIDHGFEMLILDESHRAKSHTAKRTKILIRMADRTPYRYIMSGTPILNNPMDVWAQFRILDQGKLFGDNFFAFRNTYFTDKQAGWTGDKRFSKWVVQDGAMEVIQKKVASCTSRVTKEECLDLPPLVMTRVSSSMSTKQEKCYEEMRDKLITYLGDKACVATLALTKMLRLLQIASGYVKTDEGEEISFPDNPKLKDLKDILEDIGDQKVIIWAAFKQNYADIAKVCASLDLKHTFLTGNETAKQKEKAVLDFTKGDAQVMISSPGAGGTGVNLTAASMMVYFSRSHNLGDRLQSLARNHRGGSEIHDKITCIDMISVCKSGPSIEQSVLDALDSKEEIAGQILNIRKLLTT